MTQKNKIVRSKAELAAALTGFLSPYKKPSQWNRDRDFENVTLTRCTIEIPTTNHGSIIIEADLTTAIYNTLYTNDWMDDISEVFWGLTFSVALFDETGRPAGDVWEDTSPTMRVIVRKPTRGFELSAWRPFNKKNAVTEWQKNVMAHLMSEQKITTALDALEIAKAILPPERKRHTPKI